MSVERERISRYIRAEDIPLVDQAILEPIVTNVAREMASVEPSQTVEEWVITLQKALLRGEIAIVIDDENKRVGLVRTDEPPFSGLFGASPHPGGPMPADPLNLKKWEKEE